MANKNQIQQGDVLLQRIDLLPNGVKEVPRVEGRIIIAQGEATGHQHVITAGLATLYELKGELYLETTAPVKITHDEHKELPIPEGIYKIGTVKEYDYFAEMERRVND